MRPVPCSLLAILTLAFAAALVAGPGPASAGIPPPENDIAFVSQRDGNGEIYLMNADGSAQTNLTNNLAWDESPAWSPDGSQIAFESDRDGDFEIYVINADGSGVETQLTNNSTQDIRASWSPDGTKIAFDGQNIVDGNLEVFGMNADGSAQMNLTSNLADDFSPPGSPEIRTATAAWTPRRTALTRPLVGDETISTTGTSSTPPGTRAYPYWTSSNCCSALAPLATRISTRCPIRRPHRPTIRAMTAGL